MSADPRTPLSGPEARLRDTLDQVATARPVADAWDAIVDQVTAEAEGSTVLRPLVPTGPAGPGGRAGRMDGHRRRRLALAAACIVAVAAVGVGAVARRDDDRPEQITATPTPAEATGWYVPVGLPDGWVLDSVGTDFADAAEGPAGARCPCTKQVWTAAGEVLFHSSFAGEIENKSYGGGIEQVSLGSGVLGLKSAGSIQWEQAGRVHVLAPYRTAPVGLEPGGLTSAERDRVNLAARQLVAQDGSSEPRLGGYELAESGTIPGGVRAYRTVVVTLRNTGTGRLASYGLSPRGFDVGDVFLIGAPETVNLPGQERPIDRFAVNPDAAPGDADQFLYVGRWSGADVIVGRYLEPAPTNPMYDDDLRVVGGALRPATADQWAAFLDTATDPASVDQRARANSLADLFVRE